MVRFKHLELRVNLVNPVMDLNQDRGTADRADLIGGSVRNLICVQPP